MHPKIGDNLFFRPLTADQRELNGALIQFRVYDEDLFGLRNEFIAECYVAFKNVQSEDEDGSRKQIQLILSRPTTSKYLL